jgi:hypothetical protein
MPHSDTYVGVSRYAIGVFLATMLPKLPLEPTASLSDARWNLIAVQRHSVSHHEQT